MDLLTGLTLLLLCQSAGEALARLAHLPLPGPVLGLVLMALLLRWPAVRAPVGAAATPLLSHLSLLFVPVGVGVVGHLGLIAQHGAGMLLALLVSTWVGLLVAAWVLKALWPEVPVATAEPGPG
jgi:holin-like protein